MLEGDPRVSRKVEQLGNARLVTCAIVRGELVYMAEGSRDRVANLSRVEQLLSDMDVYPVDDGAANRYGQLKAALMRHFAPRASRRRRIAINEIGFTDNDLWIAAVALQNELIVVSADSDFTRMKEVADVMAESWWTPPQPG